MVQGSGAFWPRQTWFLPFTFIASIVATLTLSSCVVVVKLLALRDALRADLVAEGATKSRDRLQDLSGAMFVDLAWVLPWVAVLVLILPTITAWMLARRQAQGAGAVGKAIEGARRGPHRPRPSGCPPTSWETWRSR